jgi:hypothetical protein
MGCNNWRRCAKRSPSATRSLVNVSGRKIKSGRPTKTRAPRQSAQGWLSNNGAARLTKNFGDGAWNLRVNVKRGKRRRNVHRAVKNGNVGTANRRRESRAVSSSA